MASIRQPLGLEGTFVDFFASSLFHLRASEDDSRVLAVGFRPGDLQLIFHQRNNRAAGVSFGTAELLDRTPGAVGGELRARQVARGWQRATTDATRAAGRPSHLRAV